jgi:hypothetical protein
VTVIVLVVATMEVEVVVAGAIVTSLVELPPTVTVIVAVLGVKVLVTTLEMTVLVVLVRYGVVVAVSVRTDNIELVTM